MTLHHDDHYEEATDEWATPQWFVQPLADAVGGFDLDPASGAEATPHAADTFTEDDDGLARDWFGRVWLNPPFSEKAAWLAKGRDEVRNGDVDTAVVLLPVDTSTGWFHDHVVEADLLWFKEGRLNFNGGGGRNRNPNFGVMIAVFGEVPDDLVEVLVHRGAVFEAGDRRRHSEQTTLEGSA